MFENYQNLRLCDVVFPGTHDAGIYGNDLGVTARTQDLTIGQQALVGTRYFDIRIAKVAGADGLQQKAYHAPGLKKKETRGGIAYQKPSPVLSALKLAGTGGDRLQDMLDQAKTFVDLVSTEFLILRFSKCGNMEEVARTCVEVLGDSRFQQNVNLNEATIGSLAGKVITVFDQVDFNTLPLDLKSTPGILPCAGLFSKGGDHIDYSPYKWGMQYFGKYSNTRSSKRNRDKQLKTMAQGPSSCPELLGMIYWTLTTNISEKGQQHKSFQSIKKRDLKLWGGRNVALQETWEKGVRNHVLARAGHVASQWTRNPNYPQQAIGRTARSFMPNIVMMDFASKSRCDTVWNLNQTTVAQLASLGADLSNIPAIMNA